MKERSPRGLLPRLRRRRANGRRRGSRRNPGGDRNPTARSENATYEVLPLHGPTGRLRLLGCLEIKAGMAIHARVVLGHCRCPRGRGGSGEGVERSECRSAAAARCGEAAAQCRPAAQQKRLTKSLVSCGQARRVGCRDLRRCPADE